MEGCWKEMGMYAWRKMTGEERERVLAGRRGRARPWHSPPHRYLEGVRYYMLSAACFEHRMIVGEPVERMDRFADELVETCARYAEKIHAWCVLPNHYHVVLCVEDLKGLVGEIGRMHGRTSYLWNKEEGCSGRQVWFNCVDREMRSWRHLMASINYVHHNPVKHGYVERWQEWPWSSAQRYLDEVGRERAEAVWREYPIGEYGVGWDD